MPPGHASAAPGVVHCAARATVAAGPQPSLCALLSLPGQFSPLSSSSRSRRCTLAASALPCRPQQHQLPPRLAAPLRELVWKSLWKAQCSRRHSGEQW